MGKTQGTNTSAIDCLKEALAAPTGLQVDEFQQQNMAPIFETVEYTKEHLKRLRKRQPKKRKAQGRRVMKINQMKAARTWDTGYRKVDCLRDCHWLGGCCDRIVLWVDGRPWPRTQDPIEAQRQIDEYQDGALPFELLSHGHTTTTDGQPTGEHAWYLRCKMARRDGLCGIYEHRPEVCRSFVPGMDPLCVKHHDHLAALARFDAGMGTLITEEIPEAQPPGKPTEEAPREHQPQEEKHRCTTETAEKQR